MCVDETTDVVHYWTAAKLLVVFFSFRLFYYFLSASWKMELVNMGTSFHWPSVNEQSGTVAKEKYGPSFNWRTFHTIRPSFLFLKIRVCVGRENCVKSCAPKRTWCPPSFSPAHGGSIRNPMSVTQGREAFGLLPFLPSSPFLCAIAQRRLQSHLFL